MPDARISGRFSFWFEVKTARNAVNQVQLTQHLLSLADEGTQERLFVVTPDAVQPNVINEINDRRIVWFNFASLSEAIEAALIDPTAAVADQARFLLRELQALLIEDGLIDNDDVVIVAARAAYPEYLARHVYVCQPGRAFRDGLTHLGFYAEKAIQPQLAHIEYREDFVAFTYEGASHRLQLPDERQRSIANAINTLLADGSRHSGESYQVFLLSGPDDSATVHLLQPIANASVSASGRPTAWTMGQRYTSISRLTKPDVVTTKDLDGTGK